MYYIIKVNTTVDKISTEEEFMPHLPSIKEENYMASNLEDLDINNKRSTKICCGIMEAFIMDKSKIPVEKDSQIDIRKFDLQK